MASIRPSIVSIILSITSDGKLYIVLITGVENSSNVSRVMFNSRACFLSYFLTRLKEFSIGFMSGLRGGIHNCFALFILSTLLTGAEFWFAALSCTNMREPFLSALRLVPIVWLGIPLVHMNITPLLINEPKQAHYA